jgi:Holliday junction resolvase RusA-like endonuclease
MEKIIARFRVDGIPKAQPRPRAFARRFGTKFQARVYDAGTSEGWKSLVAAAARPFLPASPNESPMAVWMSFDLPRPGRLNKKKCSPDPIPATCKPDCDNFAKAILDALTAITLRS